MGANANITVAGAGVADDGKDSRSALYFCVSDYDSAKLLIEHGA
ncbi:MAG: hypothetical protein AAF153_03580 [Pseudomonadota bacterium]